MLPMIIVQSHLQRAYFEEVHVVIFVFEQFLFDFQNVLLSDVDSQCPQIDQSHNDCKLVLLNLFGFLLRMFLHEFNHLVFLDDS